MTSNIELAELISEVGDWLLLAVHRLLAITSVGVPRLLWLLAIVSALRLLLLLLLLLLELVIPSETRSKKLRGRTTSCVSSCSRVWGTIISRGLSGSVLSTFRVLRLGLSGGYIIDWHRWSELWRLPLRTARCSL